MKGRHFNGTTNQKLHGDETRLPTWILANPRELDKRVAAMTASDGEARQALSPGEMHKALVVSHKGFVLSLVEKNAEVQRDL